MEGFACPRNRLLVSAGTGQSTPAPFPLPSDSFLSGTVLGGFGGDQCCGPQLSGRQWEAVIAFLRPGVHSGEQNNVTISTALAEWPLLCPGFPGWSRHLQAPIKMQEWGWVQGIISLLHGRVQAGQGGGNVYVFWEGTRKGGYWAHGVESGRSQGVLSLGRRWIWNRRSLKGPHTSPAAELLLLATDGLSPLPLKDKRERLKLALPL